MTSLQIENNKLKQEVNKWKSRSEKLWDLLDDISTLDDICKSNDVDFRKKTYNITEKRHNVACSFDGQVLCWK